MKLYVCLNPAHKGAHPRMNLCGPRILVAIQLVALLLLLTACPASKVVTSPGKTPQPILDNIAVQLREAAAGAKATREVKEALLAQGLITKAQSHAVTEILLKVDRGLNELKAKLATYDSFTPTAKADLAKAFGDLLAGYNDLQKQGVFVGNPVANKAVVILDAALAALKVYLQ
jgi:hypothetical protein